MLKRVSRGFGHSGKAQKFHVNVFVEKLDNLPASVKKCRVVWSRGPKVQMTNIKDVAKGAVVFKEQLSQIATMYKDSKGGFEPKEYRFQVQVPDKADTAKFMTVGKADLDLSFFMITLGPPQNKLIPIMFKVGPASTGYLKVAITAEVVTGAVDDDGMTEVSGMTGVNHLNDEQDLSGFNDEGEEGRGAPSPAAGGLSKKPSRFGAGSPSAPPAATTTAISSKLREAEKSAPEYRRTSGSSKALAAAAAAVDGADDDGDISPVSLSPYESAELAAEQTSAKPGSREAGKATVVAGKGRSAASAAANAAAKDAREQLFSSGPSSRGDAAGRTMSRSNNRSVPELTEDEARSELFHSSGAGSNESRKTAADSGSSGAGNRSSVMVSATAGTAPTTYQPPAAAASKPSAGRAGAVVSRSNSVASSDADASVSSGATTSAAAGSTASGNAGRRGLLDRSKGKEVQAATPSAASRGAPTSSTFAAAADARKHSLSESDDDVSAADELGYKTQPLKPPVSVSRQSTASRIPQLSGPGSRQQPAPATTGGRDADNAAYKQLAAENEKLRAQMVALRDQATEAEDARRQARLAAENAAVERDDYKEQVQELQHQLKEAIVGTLSQEEADELKQQVQDLQQLTQQKQEQLQQLQQQHEGMQATSDAQQREQLGRLEKQLAESEQKARQLEQQLREQYEHTDGLQGQFLEQSKLVKQQQEQLHSQLAMVAELEQHLADVETQAEQAKQHSHELHQQVLELAQELEATQHLLQHQQDTAANSSPARSCGTKENVPALSSMIMDLRAVVIAREQEAAAAQQQIDQIVEALVAQVDCATHQGGIEQQMTNPQLLTSAAELLHFLAEDHRAYKQLHHVVVAFKASIAAVIQHMETEAQLIEKVALLEAALDETQTHHQADLHQHHQQQPGMAAVVQQMASLEEEVRHLKQDKQQLLQQHQLQQQQHRQECGGPDSQGKAHLKAPDEEQQQGPLIRAGVQPCSRCSDSQKEMSQMKHQLASIMCKAQKLTQARDKLEIILHDFEAAAVKERQQLQQQLSAAHQAAEGVTLQLTGKQQLLEDAQQQLTHAEQRLAEMEQQLDAVQQELQHAKQYQQELQQRLEAAEAATATTQEHPLQVIALADSAGPSGLQQAVATAQEQVSDLQKQLADTEAGRRSLDTEVARLRRQLAEEQSERAALEEQLAAKLEDTDDYVAQDAVAAYEAKYNRLKTRYRELTESHREEVEQLHEEIASLQERMVDLEAAAAQLEAARSQAQHGEATLAETLAKSSKASSELASLRTENHTIMQELVSAKLELAQCREREVVGRRELYKAKETNMKLASKMTKLETLVYKK